jgi:uncharacterized protein (DUF2225 family)
METDYFLITKETLNKKRITCPVCGHFYKANGVGPANNPLLTKTIQAFLFLSSRYFKKASKAHDIGYLICPYMPMVFKNGDFIKVCTTRKDVDDLFLKLMSEAAEDSNFIIRPYLRKAKKVYYNAVRSGGQESFCHKH